MSHMQEAEALIEKISARATEILELRGHESALEAEEDIPNQSKVFKKTVRVNLDDIRAQRRALEAEQTLDQDLLSAHAVLAIAEESRRGVEKTVTMNLEGAKGPLTIFTQPDERAFDLQKQDRIRREPQGTGLRSQPIPPKFFEMPSTRIGEAAGRRLSDDDAQELAGAVFTMVQERGGVAGAARLIQHVFDGGSAEDYIDLTEVPPTEAHKLITTRDTATVYGPIPQRQSTKVIEKVACPRCLAQADNLCVDDLKPPKRLPRGHYHQERVEAAGFVLRAGRIERVDESPMRDMVDRMVKNASEKPQEAAEEPEEPSDVYPVSEAVKSDVADAMQAALYWAMKPAVPRGFNPETAEEARHLADVLVTKGFDHPSYGRTDREKAMNVTALRQRIGRILQHPRDGVRIDRFALSDLANGLAQFLTAEGWMKVTGRQEPTVVDEAALAALLEADLREVIKQPKPETTVEKIAQRAAARLVQKGWTKP